MTLENFSEPPTKETLADARRRLDATRDSVQEITSKIESAEAALAQIVRESQQAIDELLLQRRELEKKVKMTLAYLSPIRRLPMELLREIFMWTFEDHPSSAWVLSAVCRSWRRLALRIPLIWSKVSNKLFRYARSAPRMCQNASRLVQASQYSFFAVKNRILSVK